MSDTISPYGHISCLQTDGEWILTPYDVTFSKKKDDHRSKRVDTLRINRCSGVIVRGREPQVPNSAEHRSFYGIVGLLRLFTGVHVFMIEERTRVGAVRGSDIFKITKVSVLSPPKRRLPSTDDKAHAERDDDILPNILAVLESGFCFYQPDSDITRSSSSLCNLETNLHKLRAKAAKLHRQESVGGFLLDKVDAETAASMASSPAIPHTSSPSPSSVKSPLTTMGSILLGTEDSNEAPPASVDDLLADGPREPPSSITSGAPLPEEPLSTSSPQKCVVCDTAFSPMDLVAGWQTADPRFMWNLHMTAPLRGPAMGCGVCNPTLACGVGCIADESAVASTAPFPGTPSPQGNYSPFESSATPSSSFTSGGTLPISREPCHPWVIPIVYGFAQFSEAALDGLKFSMGVVSRRCVFRAGTRYGVRGVNEFGHPANYVETEHLIEAPRSIRSAISADHALCSFVQTRGSVPIVWKQRGMSYKPKISIQTEDDSAVVQALAAHVLRELHYYRRVHCIDLLNQKGPELELVRAFTTYFSRLDIEGTGIQQTVVPSTPEAVAKVMEPVGRVCPPARPLGSVANFAPTMGSPLRRGSTPMVSSSAVLGPSAAAGAGSPVTSMGDTGAVEPESPHLGRRRGSGGGPLAYAHARLCDPSGRRLSLAQAAGGSRGFRPPPLAVSCTPPSGVGHPSTPSTCASTVCEDSPLASAEHGYPGVLGSQGFASLVPEAGSPGLQALGGSAFGLDGPCSPMLPCLLDSHGGKGTPSPADGPAVTHVMFDFHAVCKGMRYDKISILMDAMSREIDSMGFHAQDGGGKESRPQIGVLRANCLDCLDRTNVLQSAFARMMLLRMLRDTGFTVPEKDSPEWVELMGVFNIMWANNGDAVSMQYAGTAALKGDYTRTGRRKAGGVLNDGVNSVTRYFLNNFKDYDRQLAVDCITGVRIPDPARPSLFVSGASRAAQLREMETSAVEFCLSEILQVDVTMSNTGMQKARRRRRESISGGSGQSAVMATLMDEGPEELLGGWIVVSMNKWAQEQERVLVVTNKAYYRVKFDFSTSTIKRYTKYPHSRLRQVTRGNIKSRSSAPVSGFGIKVECVDSEGDGAGDTIVTVTPSTGGASTPKVKARDKSTMGRNFASKFVKKNMRDARIYQPLMAPGASIRELEERTNEVVKVFTELREGLSVTDEEILCSANALVSAYSSIFNSLRVGMFTSANKKRKGAGASADDSAQ